ncbi:signal peptidase I [Streptomyces lateritius]|uniref:signal peptidase I n=1 Tax=Streptomyces lateritius TaxID=67313 RepID=UPI0021AB85BF|nr:signal peptidase I [Streptomyces lateritius]
MVRTVFRVLGALGLVLMVGVVAHVGAGYTTAEVSSDAMRPTYAQGDRVLLERTEAGAVRRGDVVLQRTAGRYGGLAVIQRVVGVGGDRVAQEPGEPVTVNGKPLQEPYVNDGDPSGTTAPAYDVVVPEGRLFLLGDHRANSNDSRFFLDDRSGTVPEGAVLARAFDDRSGLVGAGLTALLGLVLVLGALAAEITGRRRHPVR